MNAEKQKYVLIFIFVYLSSLSAVCILNKKIGGKKDCFANKI